MRGRGGNQDPAELAGFLALVSSLGVRRYMEIGCRNGDTFHAVMRTVGTDGYGLAIDLPENADTKANLSATIDELNGLGISCHVQFGNSRDYLTRSVAWTRAPFDLILIDGDHRYEGIKSDWATYGDLAPIVAFHDVAAPDGHMSDGHVNGVARFWNEVRVGHPSREIVTPGSDMGFGILGVAA